MRGASLRTEPEDLVYSNKKRKEPGSLRALLKHSVNYSGVALIYYVRLVASLYNPRELNLQLLADQSFLCLTNGLDLLKNETLLTPDYTFLSQFYTSISFLKEVLEDTQNSRISKNLRY